MGEAASVHYEAAHYFPTRFHNFVKEKGYIYWITFLTQTKQVYLEKNTFSNIVLKKEKSTPGFKSAKDYPIFLHSHS